MERRKQRKKFETGMEFFIFISWKIHEWIRWSQFRISLIGCVSVCELQFIHMIQILNWHRFSTPTLHDRFSSISSWDIFHLFCFGTWVKIISHVLLFYGIGFFNHSSTGFFATQHVFKRMHLFLFQTHTRTYIQK